MTGTFFIQQLLKQLKRLDWTFLVWWTLVNTMAFGAAAWTMHEMDARISSLLLQRPGLIGDSAIFAIFGAIAGILIGLCQWLLLRKKLSNPFCWVSLSLVAYAIIFAGIWPISDMGAQLLNGVTLAMLQWLVLRQQYRRHYWWGVAGSLSWIAAEFVTPFSVHMTIVDMTINGFIYGGCSGLAFIWLFLNALPVNIKTSLRKISSPHVAVFAVSWMLMNGIGWMIGFGSIGQMLVELLNTKIGFTLPVLLNKVILECLSALWVWFVLWRQWFRGTKWWLIWSGIGAASGMAVWMYSGLEHAEGIVMYGAIVGFFQWFVLTQKIDGFVPWMVVRTGSWAGSLLVVSQVGRRFNQDLGWAAGGVVYGILTGMLLAWKLRKRFSGQ